MRHIVEFSVMEHLVPWIEDALPFSGEHRLARLLDLPNFPFSQPRWAFEYADEGSLQLCDLTDVRGQCVEVTATLVSHDLVWVGNDWIWVPTDIASECSQPGVDASRAIDECLRIREFRKAIDSLSEDRVRNYVKECGGWDDHETATWDTILKRFVWLISCTAREEWGGLGNAS